MVGKGAVRRPIEWIFCLVESECVGLSSLVLGLLAWLRVWTLARPTGGGLLSGCWKGVISSFGFFSKVFSARGHHWALRSDREWLAVAQEGVRAGIFLGRNSWIFEELIPTCVGCIFYCRGRVRADEILTRLAILIYSETERTFSNIFFCLYLYLVYLFIYIRTFDILGWIALQYGITHLVFIHLLFRWMKTR